MVNNTTRLQETDQEENQKVKDSFAYFDELVARRSMQYGGIETFCPLGTYFAPRSYFELYQSFTHNFDPKLI